MTIYVETSLAMLSKKMSYFNCLHFYNAHKKHFLSVYVLRKAQVASKNSE